MRDLPVNTMKQTEYTRAPSEDVRWFRQETRSQHTHHDVSITLQ